MKLGDILKTVGTGLIATYAGPAAPLIIGGINNFLSDDDKLPENATVEQANTAISKLTPEQQASVLEKEYDVKIEAYNTLQVMLQANAQSKHTTRPKIAYQSFQVIAFVNIVAISLWAWAVINSDNPLASINDSWAFIGTLTGTLTTLLYAYFGILRDESKDKMNSAQGHKVDPVSGLIGKLFK